MLEHDREKHALGPQPDGGHWFSEKIVLRHQSAQTTKCSNNKVLRQRSRCGVPHLFEEELILRMSLSPITSGGSCREQECPISASPESP
jgi:hypothetical protein